MNKLDYKYVKKYKNIAHLYKRISSARFIFGKYRYIYFSSLKEN